ncbi:hypothetical protein CVIRNUC_011116 [Coccomyxa viridis]|uniref:Uncharacterized protein n=1 Tax=Coccomyxa viridis TaxID=1274662 RepID=A0AAV1IPH0_9CHLO|nr:hypothetical protein CVIRNUC_011116 [Coccomyxa viridis]
MFSLSVADPTSVFLDPRASGPFMQASEHHDHAKKGKKTPAGKLNALFRRSGGKPAPPAETPRRSHHSHSLSGTSHLAPSGRAGIRIGGLEAFEDGGFDLKNDLSSLTEKGIDVLRTDLAALDIECAEELRKSVHANYIPFITASQGVSHLDAEMGALRNLLTNTAVLVNALKEVAQPSLKPTAAQPKPDGSANGSRVDMDWAQTTDGLRWSDALDEVDSTIAERRPLNALQALRRIEKMVARPPAGQGDPLDTARIMQEARAERQMAEVEERQRKLADLAESALTEAASGHMPADGGGNELCMAAGVLGSVAGSPHAAHKLLSAHSSRLRSAQQRLLKPQNAGGSDADGTESAGALAQGTFQTLARAANDMAAVFADDTPKLSSLLVTWALQETQRCALLIKRHALSPFAAPAGLAPTVQCCCLALAHCAALRASHALALGPTLLRELWPACDQARALMPRVLERRLIRIGEEIRMGVTAEVDRIAGAGLPSTDKTGWAQLTAAFPSADQLLDEIQAIVQILQPLAGPKVGEAVRKTVNEMFGVFAQSMAAAFQKFMRPDGTFPPRLAPAAEPAMETAASLVDQFLPELMATQEDKCGENLDMTELMRQIDALAADLGMQRAEP